MRISYPARRLTAAIVATAAVLTAGQVTRGQTPADAESPVVRVLGIPGLSGPHAIWGAIGADRDGRLYVGASSSDAGRSPSARLFELHPPTGSFTELGQVLDELARHRPLRPGERQMKIHSRIVQAADGLRYFASMDESGEEADGSRLPTWGGHLWRLDTAGNWQHLAETPEALIAVATGGPYVYALGYFEHVLYQFDTRTSAVRSVTVGSDAGHVSRNFFADDRGHAYVPRVVVTADGASAVLVELDASLTEVGSHPLDEYFERSPQDSHGIVGLAASDSGGWFFTTGKGRLYQVEPNVAGVFRLTDLGWMHPAGSRYPASLFRDAATGTIYAVSMPSNWGGRAFDWIVRRADGRTTVAPFPYGTEPAFPQGALVYGSMARDREGRFYSVGTMGGTPLVLQVSAPGP